MEGKACFMRTMCRNVEIYFYISKLFGTISNTTVYWIVGEGLYRLVSLSLSNKAKKKSRKSRLSRLLFWCIFRFLDCCVPGKVFFFFEDLSHSLSFCLSTCCSVRLCLPACLSVLSLLPLCPPPCLVFTPRHRLVLESRWVLYHITRGGNDRIEAVLSAGMLSIMPDLLLHENPQVSTVPPPPLPPATPNRTSARPLERVANRS